MHRSPYDAPAAGQWLAEAADALAVPLLWLRCDATLVHANAAGLELLGHGTLLERVGERVTTPHKRSRKKFSQALGEVAAQPAGTVRWLRPPLLGCAATLTRLGAPATPLLLALAAQGAGAEQRLVEVLDRLPALAPPRHQQG